MMYDYMKALHARFCREPELQKAREELEQAYREIKARLGQQDQEILLQDLYAIQRKGLPPVALS